MSIEELMMSWVKQLLAHFEVSQEKVAAVLDFESIVPTLLKLNSETTGSSVIVNRNRQVLSVFFMLQSPERKKCLVVHKDHRGWYWYEQQQQVKERLPLQNQQDLQRLMGAMC